MNRALDVGIESTTSIETERGGREREILFGLFWVASAVLGLDYSKF